MTGRRNVLGMVRTHRTAERVGDGKNTSDCGASRRLSGGYAAIPTRLRFICLIPWFAAPLVLQPFPRDEASDVRSRSF